MRGRWLPLLGLLIACASDAAGPVRECTDCDPAPPVLTFLCADAVPDEALYQSHFSRLEIVDAGTGQPGYPDGELGVRFSRKASLELRADVLAPLPLFVCVRSLTTHATLLSGLHQADPPSAAIPLGRFERDRYVLQVRTGATLLRSIPFASE